MRREVEQERILPAIKLLGKCHDGLGAPRGTVDGAIDAYVERLLLDDLSNFESQQEHASGRGAQVDGRAVSLCSDYCFFSNQKSLNHGERILTKSFMEVAAGSAVRRFAFVTPMDAGR